MKPTAIAPGIDGLFIKNDRFSTTHISINLYIPLNKTTLAHNALLTYVLSSCCAEYPDFTALNLKICQLYGADIGGVADKVGDTQVLRFFSFTVDDELTDQDSSVVLESFELLCKMLFEPSVENEAFKTADLQRERRLTLEKIEGLINEKRSYAINKTIFEMYKNEAFGQFKTGSIEDVCAITEKSLYKAWKELLSSAKVRVQVIGKKLPDGLFENLAERFEGCNRNPMQIVPAVPKNPPQKVNRVDEVMEVAQGKLVMGFTTTFTGNDTETAFLAVFSDLLGGGPYSKLFKNVREKLSLCYYCAARCNRAKGYLMIDSGVEAENAIKAEEEILKQLEDIKSGNFDAEDLAASIRSIKESLRGLNDSQAALDGWYSLKVVGNPTSPEEFIAALEGVTKEDVIRAAGLYTLDTVYRIVPKGKEGVMAYEN
ncbi:MAG: insulinase family protein [Clostridia bacterium]|nr:insulinase family protein [Clostridia bacterium]